ncbi:hypothetical protein RB213_008633, partial [Colletotrichum asianum]
GRWRLRPRRVEDQDHRRCLFCHLAGIRLKILIRDDDAQLTAGIGWPGCLRETSVGSQYSTVDAEGPSR